MMNLELLLMMYLAPRTEVSMESYTCPKREVESTEKHVEAMRRVKLQVLNYCQQLHYGPVTLSEPQVHYYTSYYNSAILHQIARFSTYYSKLTSMSCDFSPSLYLHLPVAKALDSSRPQITSKLVVRKRPPYAACWVDQYYRALGAIDMAWESRSAPINLNHCHLVINPSTTTHTEGQASDKIKAPSS